MKMNLRLIAPLFAATAAACSSSPEVSIGDPVGGALADYAASWDGYAEAYQFEDGSDRVRLRIDSAGTGTLEVGDSPHFPPATDPNVGYPPGTTSQQGFPSVAQMTLYAGFGYPLHDTRVDNSRIRLGADPADLYSGWCALQQPVSDERNGVYNCLPNWGYSYGIDGCWQPDPTTKEAVTVDCGKLMLCGILRVCRCTASGCTIPSAAGNAPVQVDAALTADGTQLTGTLILGDQRITIRMSR
jgi:hypothetical protein